VRDGGGIKGKVRGGWVRGGSLGGTTRVNGNELVKGPGCNRGNLLCVAVGGKGSSKILLSSEWGGKRERGGDEDEGKGRKEFNLGFQRRRGLEGKKKKCAHKGQKKE